ncbi:MAG: cytochrome c peroxidase [Chitinophagales bacterium]|nr:cytochrome c peroxidase [Chitinophagales bacterium]
MMRYWLYGSLVCLLALTSCKKDDNQDEYVLNLPKGFPALSIPADNQLTHERVQLGKLLFFDPRLSRDSSISCSSCHLPEKAFSDVFAISPGVEGRKGFRNSPTLANIGYSTRFFMDGGVPTLELQVLAPIADHNEMDFSLPALVERLIADKNYQFMAKQAYGRDTLDVYCITRALAAYERTLLSGNSPYDQYINDGSTTSLTPDEIRGMNLFFGKANCSKCHSGHTFTDYTFRNNGIYESYADSGRCRVTQLPEDRGKFKVPTLRNIALTAPYMHDGSFSSLEDILEHYNTGGKNHPNKDPLVQPLNLSDQEKQDIIAFLRSLTDTEFINDPSHLP